MEAVVLVDAENVRRSAWPNVSRQELADMCGAWSAQHGVPVEVVYDGRAPDGSRGDATHGARVTMVGTGAGSADDWLVRRAAELAAAGTPYRLVTSDRAVRAAAGGAAEKVTGGGSFLRELLAG